MRCPACGAALKVDGEISTVTCRYCGMPVKISTDKQMMRHDSVTRLISIGNYSEAYNMVLELIDENPNVPTLWLLRSNCSQSVSDRDSSYEMADELLRTNPTELKLLEVQWTSMVFNWGAICRSMILPLNLEECKDTACCSLKEIIQLESSAYPMD